MPSRCKSRTLKAGAPVSLVYRFTEHCAPVPICGLSRRAAASEANEVTLMGQPVRRCQTDQANRRSNRTRHLAHQGPPARASRQVVDPNRCADERHRKSDFETVISLH